MRDLGNTLIVVEHDEDTMREADWLIDVGPGAGVLVVKLLRQALQSKLQKQEINYRSVFIGQT